MLISCKKSDDPIITPSDTMELSVSSLDFTNNKDASLIIVKTKKDWTATKTADWISLSASTGKGETAFLIGASDNLQFSRSTTVTIQSGGLSKEITIKQKGSPVITFTVNNISFNMVLVAGGQYSMGDGSNFSFGLPHQVKLNDFYISETELTNGVWQAVLKNLPYNEPNMSDFPVCKTTWDSISTNFIPELNKLTGKTFRLPTEAEWEFAALGGTKTKGYKYAGSNTLDDVAWYYANAGSVKHKVKEKLPNELGLYDMSGNVNEWCNDWFDTYYGFPIINNVITPPDLQTNPTGPTTGTKKLVRGGNFEDDELWGFSYCNVKFRLSIKPSGYDTYDGNPKVFFMSKNTGFRLVIAL